MHLCFLCNEYPPAKHGGIGSFVQTLSRELVKLGHRVCTVGVYPILREIEEDDQGVRVVRLAQGRIPGLRVAENRVRVQGKLNEIHAAQPIDIVEGSERSFFLVSKRFAVPKIIRMHGGYCYFKVTLGETPGKWMELQERRSFETADHICAVSRFVAETTRELLALGERPIEVILNPVDLDTFHPMAEVEEEPGRITYVGTVVEKKGIRQLVQAMPKIVAAHPRAKLYVYGNDTAMPAGGGSFTEHLRRQVPEALAGHVNFEGPVARTRIPELLARSSVCVYPSHMEALPIAWVEGLAMGKAVLASRTGPGPEVLIDGESGLLCDPHQPDSIAAGMIRLLSDAPLRARLGQAARRRAEERFSLRTLIHENVRYYERCAQEGVRRR